MPLSNASSAASRPPSHGSGSGWFATPFLYDSFIHYFTPVYPDAIHAEGLRHIWREPGSVSGSISGLGKRTSGYWPHRHCGAQIVFNLTSARQSAQAILKNVGRRFAAWQNLSTD